MIEAQIYDKKHYNESPENIFSPKFSNFLHN